MLKRICIKCNVEKLLSEFIPHKTRPQGRHNTCKKCKNKRYRELRKIYPDRYISYVRKHKFGIDNDHYNLLFKLQNGLCAICTEKSKKKRLGVDHKHDPFKIRGLLCDTCNRALGMFKEDKCILWRAIKYLEFHADA